MFQTCKRIYWKTSTHDSALIQFATFASDT